MEAFYSFHNADSANFNWYGIGPFVGGFVYQPPAALANTSGLDWAVVQAYHGSQNGGGREDGEYYQYSMGPGRIVRIAHIIGPGTKWPQKPLSPYWKPAPKGPAKVIPLNRYTPWAPPTW